MGCQNYNPIAAAHAPEKAKANASTNSALYGQWNCNCCEIGAIYTVFGTPTPLPLEPGQDPVKDPTIVQNPISIN